LDPDAIWDSEEGWLRMRVLDGDGHRRRGRVSYGCEFAASHCNQWGFFPSNFGDDLFGHIWVILKPQLPKGAIVNNFK